MDPSEENKQNGDAPPPGAVDRESRSDLRARASKGKSSDKQPSKQARKNKDTSYKENNPPSPGLMACIELHPP